MSTEAAPELSIQEITEIYMDTPHGWTSGGANNIDTGDFRHLLGFWTTAQYTCIATTQEAEETLPDVSPDGRFEIISNSNLVDHSGLYIAYFGNLSVERGRQITRAIGELPLRINVDYNVAREAERHNARIRAELRAEREQAVAEA